MMNIHMANILYITVNIHRYNSLHTTVNNHTPNIIHITVNTHIYNNFYTMNFHMHNIIYNMGSIQLYVDIPMLLVVLIFGDLLTRRPGRSSAEDQTQPPRPLTNCSSILSQYPVERRSAA